jgi:hypothetical protein
MYPAVKKIFGDSIEIDVRTDWSENFTFDYYSEETSTAVMSYGRQRYEYVSYFHQEYDDFVKQRKRDQKLVDLCVQNGVCIIIVPYTVPKEECENFIRRKMLDV